MKTGRCEAQIFKWMIKEYVRFFLKARIGASKEPQKAPVAMWSQYLEAVSGRPRVALFLECLEASARFVSTNDAG